MSRGLQGPSLVFGYRKLRPWKSFAIFIGRPITSISVNDLQRIQASTMGAGLNQLGIVLSPNEDGVEVVSDFVTELGGNDPAVVALPDGFFFGCEVPPAIVHEAFNPVMKEA